LRKPLADKESLRVLDIGCGTGYLLHFLRQHYPLNGEPVGLDISAHALKFCQQRGWKDLILGSATSVPLPSNSFDLIICIDTIQHLSPSGADQTAINEFSRLLSKGGLVYLRTNSALGRVALEGADPNQYRRYKLTDVEEMLQRADLEVVRSTYLNCIPGAAGMVKEYFKFKKQGGEHQHCHHDRGHVEHEQHDHSHNDRSHGNQHAESHEPTHKTAAIGPGLAIKNYAPEFSLLNKAMYSVLALEAFLLQNINLPFGHSSGFVARKR
jgi:ubiquinone/menaquinone biosynthesis C-methylase UbiE